VGSTIIDNITVTDGTKTGGGAVVVENISEPGLYLGVPAKLRPALRSKETA
jgi:serine acetyltransferase